MENINIYANYLWLKIMEGDVVFIFMSILVLLLFLLSLCSISFELKKIFINKKNKIKDIIGSIFISMSSVMIFIFALLLTLFREQTLEGVKSEISLNKILHEYNEKCSKENNCNSVFANNSDLKIIKFDINAKNSVLEKHGYFLCEKDFDGKKLKPELAYKTSERLKRECISISLKENEELINKTNSIEEKIEFDINDIIEKMEGHENSPKRISEILEKLTKN